MGYKDSETQREYQRDLMRTRRLEAKGKSKVAVADPEPEPIPDPEPEPVPQVETPSALRLPSRMEKARQIAEATRELLETRGWILWKATKLDNEVLVIVRDESVKGFPEGFPVFTNEELRKLNQDHSSLLNYRMIIDVKKTFGEVSVQ